jgi:SHS2 domain-containing protein
MNKDFELIGYTADAGIRASGRDLSQAFANAARGMFSLIIDIEEVNEVIFRDVEVAAPDKETLLVEWLNELVFLFDTEMLLFKRFHIGALTETLLKARCYGEKIDRSRHEIKRGVKSATYHDLKVERLNDGSCRVQVLIDL